MKILKEIIRSYKKQLKEADYSKLASYDIILIEKWKNRIPNGWYGFDGINELWGKIIDKFLTELEKECPDFQIHQIKLKFGGLRFYVDLGKISVDKRAKIYIQINKLEEALFSKSLIY